MNKLGIKDEYVVASLMEIIRAERSEIYCSDAVRLLSQIAPEREDVQQILYETAISVSTNPLHNTAFLRLYKAVVEDIEIDWPN